MKDLLAGKSRIIKLPIQILTDAEKRYLSNVIEPFKDRVRYIIKREGTTDEYILMDLKHYKYNNDLVKLPAFEKGTMYKGMKIRERYTLEELYL